MEMLDINQVLKRASAVLFNEGYGENENHLIQLLFDFPQNDIITESNALKALVNQKETLGETVFVEVIGNIASLKIVDKSGINLITIPNLTIDERTVNSMINAQKTKLQFELVTASNVGSFPATIRSTKDTDKLLFTNLVLNK